MPARSKVFQRRLEAAITDPNLARALDRALSTFRKRREQAFDGLDFEAMRRDMRRRKERAIAQLPELIEQFTREAEAVGAQVYLATTADEACAIVREIAVRHGVRLAIKTKSMATEEIRLTQVLEQAGIQVVESDLGEWIMQLAGEHPSHLIAPAIHKSREEIAALFSRKLGREIRPEPAELVAVARTELRRFFIEAGLGITGANAAVAETGTLVLVTNEGNAELVTTLPPVHVAVVGVEKIVPTLDDVTAMLGLLPRSGTAQRLTVRVSFITGPSRTADIELTPVRGAHGPRELHIVLLDNGRSAARNDPELVDTLYCIRCGACSNVCPPYQVVSGHLFGYIYTGPIGLPLTAVHHGLEPVADPQSLCLSCNACEQVCPVAIPIPRLILDVRARVVEHLGVSWLKRQVVERWTRPASGDRWARLAALATAPLADREGYLSRLPFVDGATEQRHLIAPARRPLRDRVRHLAGRDAGDQPAPTARFPSSRAAGATIAFFPGCLTDRVLPEMGEAVIRVLEACGCRVLFPLGQHCCGLVAANMGDRQRARAMARQTIEVLEETVADWVVTHSTSCLVAVVQDYQHLFRTEPDWQERAARQAERMVDLTTFLERVAALDPPQWARPGPRVTYHDACQSANALGIRAAPRRLLTEVLGCELVEMRESSVCCGFGGSFSLDYPRLSSIILGRKLDNALATGAELIVADNPGCLLQIRGGLHARGSAVRALHVAELFAERLAELAEPSPAAVAPPAVGIESTG
jgi:iron-sulfur cluster protein